MQSTARAEWISVRTQSRPGRAERQVLRGGLRTNRIKGRQAGDRLALLALGVEGWTLSLCPATSNNTPLGS